MATFRPESAQTGVNPAGMTCAWSDDMQAPYLGDALFTDEESKRVVAGAIAQIVDELKRERRNVRALRDTVAELQEAIRLIAQEEWK